MCPRFVFLLIMWVLSWPRLSQREEARQTAETLILRHQLVVLQRRQPRLCVPKTSSRPGQLPAPATGERSYYARETVTGQSRGARPTAPAGW
jgi:hypothetical protein